MTRMRDDRFQKWLQAQLDERDWSHSKLARELEVFKGTVGRWLLPEGHEMHRRPNVESCRRLAVLFGVDLGFILELTGIEAIPDERNLTTLQRDVLTIISLIPDNVLYIVYMQLRPLIDPQVQRLINDRLAVNSSAT